MNLTKCFCSTDIILSFYRVISDVHLPMPVRLGIFGKWGTGKSRMTRGILWCMRQACDVHCSNLGMYNTGHIYIRPLLKILPFVPKNANKCWLQYKTVMISSRIDTLGFNAGYWDSGIPQRWRPGLAMMRTCNPFPAMVYSHSKCKLLSLTLAQNKTRPLHEVNYWYWSSHGAQCYKL